MVSGIVNCRSVRWAGLFAGVLGAVLSSGAAMPAYAITSCTATEINAGFCVIDGQVNGDHVDLVGDSTRPGDAGSTGSSGGTGDGDELCTVIINDQCVGSSPPKNVDEPPAPPDSVSDLASFIPHRPAIAWQPAGWSFEDLPMNLYASASAHVVSGSLLGSSAQVRFTPARFRWIYGDGTGRWFSVRGAPWSAVQSAWWSPTATSHVFLDQGTYLVRLTVDHRAEYRFAGGSWHTVTGYVARAALSRTVTVVSGVTVLVD